MSRLNAKLIRPPDKVASVASREERATSFGAIASDYDRLRPAPPDDAIGWLLPSRCETAVDLAAGTGLLSRVLARKVNRVVAIEPDERMAAVLRARSADVNVIRGVAEALPLADASVDAVLVSSAWHWFDPARAVPELGRVLRDGGRLGVIWHGVDPEASWVRELRRRPSPQADAAQGTDAAQPNQARSRFQAGLPETGMFGNVARAHIDSARTMAADDFIDMLATYSEVITATDEERAAELTRVRTALSRQFPGATEIQLPMRAWCWRADRMSRAIAALYKNSAQGRRTDLWLTRRPVAHERHLVAVRVPRVPLGVDHARGFVAHERPSAVHERPSAAHESRTPRIVQYSVIPYSSTRYCRVPGGLRGTRDGRPDGDAEGHA